MAPIKLLKLITGETLIGEVDELTLEQKDVIPVNFWTVRIGNFLKLQDVFNPDTENVDVELTLWGSYFDLKPIEFPQHSVLCVAEVQPDFISFYKSRLADIYEMIAQSTPPRLTKADLPKNARVEGDFVVFDTPQDMENWEKLLEEDPPSKIKH